MTITIDTFFLILAAICMALAVAGITHARFNTYYASLLALILMLIF